MSEQNNRKKRKALNHSENLSKKSKKSLVTSKIDAGDHAEDSPMEIETQVEENGSEENINDEIALLYDTQIKFPKAFKMSHFRRKLRGKDFIGELRHFLSIAEKNSNIVKKYLKRKGKPLELVEAMERIDKSQLFHICYICQALQLVLMEILSAEDNINLESAIAASRYFLKGNTQAIETLLKSPNVGHRKCALKLLSAIVCLEPQLGRHLLTSFNVISNIKSMEQLMSHSKFELYETETVRKCYIHFILSYFIDGNQLLIQNILDKHALILSLLSGLRYDDNVTVCVVLSTLKKFVLESQKITKTKKIYIFETNVVRQLFQLYEWKGPKFYAAMFNMKKVDLSQFINEEEKQSVRQAVHEFLVLLLSSRKYGIVFDSMTYIKEKMNKIPRRALGNLEKPWFDDLKTDLVIKILNACPELASGLIKKFTFGFSQSSKENHLVLAKFYDKVISSLHPTIMRSGLSKIGITDATLWIKAICLAPEMLIHLRGKHWLRSDDYQMRISSAKLLLTMFRQYCNYMDAIVQRERLKGNDLRKFKFDMIDHIFQNFPTVESILLSLFSSIQEQDNKDVDVLAHLEYTIDLVLLICKANRSFVDKTGTIVNYIELLRPLYESSKENPDNVRIELKAIKLILLLYPNYLKPGSQQFENVLHSFINVFIFGSGDTQREAGNLLQQIFENTGLFDKNILEIDIWIQALKSVNEKSVEAIRELMLKILQCENTEITEQTKILVQDSGPSVNFDELFEKIEKNITVQGFVDVPRVSRFYQLFYESDQLTEEVFEYFELVSLLLFHYIPVADPIRKLYDNKFTKFRKYFGSWIDNGKQAKFPSDNIPFLQDIYTSILNGKKNFAEVFKRPSNTEEKKVSILHDEELFLSDVVQDERYLLIYVELIIFLIVNMTKKSELEAKHIDSASHFINYILEAIKKSIPVIAENFHFESEDRQPVPKGSLQHIIKYIYCNHVILLENFNVLSSKGSDLQFIKFIENTTIFLGKQEVENLDDHTIHFRNKIVKEIQSAAMKSRQFDFAFVLHLISTVFPLSESDCYEILEICTRLNIEQLRPTSGSGYLDILVFSLNRLVVLRKSFQDSALMTRIVEIYLDLKKCEDADTLNLDRIEEALFNFLTVAPRYIKDMPNTIFEIIFDMKKVTKPATKLASLLLERNDRLVEVFLQKLAEKSGQKELIYPLLSVAVAKNVKFTKELLNYLYQEFKNGFIKTIEKPQKAGVIYKENPQVSIHLIDECMPQSECNDFCKKSFKFDAVEPYQIKIIEAIYRKAIRGNLENPSIRENIFLNFFNTFLQLYLAILKKDNFSYEKVKQCNFTLFKWVGEYNNNEQSYAFEKLLSSQAWLNFCKNCLKLGMKTPNEESEISKHDQDEANSSLLKILSYLCDFFYEDNGDNDNIAQFFELATTHSRFFEIALNQKPTEVKTQTMHLLFVLAKKNLQVMNEKHIPIFLGAYQAKLSFCDRYILALLQFYEQNGISLSKYRPFIWGESAILYYSLKDKPDENLNLEQREPLIFQVMSIIELETSNYTLAIFPVWRKLNTLKQLPVIEFPDPNVVCSYGPNYIERMIENNIPVDKHITVCPRKDNAFDECYDPAFIVPLMVMCFAAEAVSHPVRPLQNGLLGLTFASLSSQDKEMRMAAGCAQLRYRQHFENNKFLNKPLWTQAYDSIQNGMHALRLDWLKHKKSGVPRAPLISTIFLAKTFNLIQDPLNILYKLLTMYLRLKDTFDFLCVPEFNVLFHNPDVEHHKFRVFILETIRDGIKCSSDLTVLITKNIFKALLGFYNSNISTREENLLILSILSICCKIPASSKLMIDLTGILPWLNSVINQIEYHHFDVIEAVISILNNLWYSIKANEKVFLNLSQIEDRIFYSLVKLTPFISGRISLTNLTKFINILNKTADKNHGILSEENLNKLIGCVRKHFDKNIWTIEYLKSNGIVGVECNEVYCKKLFDQSVGNDEIFILSCLRKFVIDWIKKSN